MEHKDFFTSKILDEGISPYTSFANIQQEFRRKINEIKDSEEFRYEIPGKFFYGSDADMDISSDEE